ncbi:unnamed protein product [Cuscuta epithymum]|uniref:Uncharacterized protein n=1 Tax=Cuscuta epithymum TaxID=186058 RepID=A0AAV0DDF7_9ASTE|nr:unnamed protein product [Cuscuta epithymum]
MVSIKKVLFTQSNASTQEFVHKLVGRELKTFTKNRKVDYQLLIIYRFKKLHIPKLPMFDFPSEITLKGIFFLKKRCNNLTWLESHPSSRQRSEKKSASRVGGFTVWHRCDDASGGV